LNTREAEVAQPVAVERVAGGRAIAIPAQRWTAVAAIALVLLTFALLWPTTSSLMVRWEDTVRRTYTHGYLIVALSLWLLWRDRAMLPPARTSFVGAGALIAGGVLWLIAWRAGLQIVHQALLPALAFFAVLTCCGWAAMRRMWFAIAYLYFAVPIWDAINPVLQWTSVFAVRQLLRLAGIPAFFADNTFQIPAGSFEIADGCSGLHFFVVAVAIAVLYGAINRDRWGARVNLVLFAAVLAMATNWLRIVIIVLAGHVTDMQHYLVSGEHYSFGWFMFAGAMLLFFLVVRRWPLADEAAGQVHQDSQASRVAPIPGFALAVSTMAAAPLWNAVDDNVASSADAHSLPTSIAWQTSAVTSSWSPHYRGADVEQRSEYDSAGAMVEAYTATYLQQLQGKELVGHGNSMLSETMRATTRAKRAADSSWSELRAKGGAGDEWLLRFAYRIDDQWYASALRAQLSYGVRSLFAAPLSSIVVARSRCSADCSDAEAALTQFTNAFAP
jgi:exosortase A